MPGYRERGQVQVATIFGLVAIVTAALAAITIIASVAPSNPTVTHASAPNVPLDAVAIIVLLAVLLAFFVYTRGMDA